MGCCTRQRSVEERGSGAPNRSSTQDPPRKLPCTTLLSCRPFRPVSEDVTGCTRARGSRLGSLPRWAAERRCCATRLTVNPRLVVTFAFFKKYEIGAILVSIVKTSPQGSQPLLSIEEMLIRGIRNIRSTFDWTTHELLVIADSQHERCSRRQALDHALEEVRDIRVRPRLEALESRKLDVTGSDEGKPVR